VATDVVLSVKTTEHTRFTVVLERRGDRWLTTLWHDSVPAAGQEEGEAFAA